MGGKNMYAKSVNLDGRWFFLDLEIFHSKVFLYIGSRADMAEAAEKVLYDDFLQEKDRARMMAQFLMAHWDGRWGESAFVGDALGSCGFNFIRLDKMQIGNLDDILVLGHECLHTAIRVLNYVGVKETDACEALCYTHEHIFGKLMEQMCDLSLRLDEENQREKTTGKDKE